MDELTFFLGYYFISNIFFKNLNFTLQSMDVDSYKTEKVKLPICKIILIVDIFPPFFRYIRR